LPVLLGRVQTERAADGSYQIRSIKLRSVHTVIGASLNDFNDRLLVGVFCQENERYRASALEKVRKQFSSAGILRLMFEQNQPVVFLQQHRLCFLQRTRVIEFRPEGIRVSMEDFPDEKEILFPASHQQDAQ
jgi:hypothetical protein